MPASATPIWTSSWTASSTSPTSASRRRTAERTSIGSTRSSACARPGRWASAGAWSRPATSAASAPATSTAPRPRPGRLPLRPVRRQQRQLARRLPGAAPEIRGRQRPQRVRVGHHHARPDHGAEDQFLIGNVAAGRGRSGELRGQPAPRLRLHARLRCRGAGSAMAARRTISDRRRRTRRNERSPTWWRIR